MSYTSGLLIPVIAAAGLVSGLSAQTTDAPKSGLTPREMFYTPRTSQPAANPQKKGQPKETQPKQNTPQQKETAKSNPSGKQGQQHDTGPTELPGGAVLIRASTQTPLVLKYTIVKRAGSQSQEVPATAVFHAKDGIQLKVEASSAGYLYVVNQGSSGTWKPIFPSPEISGGNNYVEAYQPVTLPRADLQMTFDQQRGTENLFVVFSRTPVPDFEDLIYSLRGKPAQGGQPTPAGQPAPEAQPAKPASGGRVMMASAAINDATVGHLRTVYARDLVIEKVTPETPADSSAKTETAAYVTNPKGGPDSRLVADLHLEHQ